MAALDDAPLVEAIFELHWGESTPGNFTYSNEEKGLFAGQFSAAAMNSGYSNIELLTSPNQPMSIPGQATHRFRTKANTWPCFQVGLGVLTVNQIEKGYSWKSFQETIGLALEMFEQANAKLFEQIKPTLKLELKYQDGFVFDDTDNASAFVKEHFEIEASLPDEYIGHDFIQPGTMIMNFSVINKTIDPPGHVRTMVGNAAINNKPGLIMDTSVESSAQVALPTISIKNILEWTQKAHVIQQHTFKTLIKPSAYKKK